MEASHDHFIDYAEQYHKYTFLITELTYYVCGHQMRADIKYESSLSVGYVVENPISTFI